MIKNSSASFASQLMFLRRGFTLIELLVVIAIIGLLSSVVLASLNTARIKGQTAATETQMSQYRTAFALYYSLNKEYPDPNDTGWHCLGTYSDNRCWSNGAYSTSATLDSQLSSVIGSAPGGPLVASWEGYLYRCTTRSNNACTGYDVRWFVPGTNQKCNGEIVISPNYNGTGTTYCRILR